jgi:predicted Zn-ribbon and HTH transcriptional regulator
MNVLVRSKRGEGTRRTRLGPSHRVEGHLNVVESRPAPETSEPAESEAAETDERRLTNDPAMYSCQCGYVFEAPVSTSVHCPHCGDTQAW